MGGFSPTLDKKAFSIAADFFRKYNQAPFSTLLSTSLRSIALTIQRAFGLLQASSCSVGNSLRATSKIERQTYGFLAKNSNTLGLSSAEREVNKLSKNLYHVLHNLSYQYDT